jgi:hypothetical protein
MRSSALAVFEVDRQLVLARRLHWKVGWLFAFEDAVDVTGRHPVGFHQFLNVLGLAKWKRFSKLGNI